jgi:hypothetical protein
MASLWRACRWYNTLMHWIVILPTWSGCIAHTSLAWRTRSHHIGLSLFSTGKCLRGCIIISSGWYPQRAVRAFKAATSVVSSALYPTISESSECQPGYRGWGSKVIQTLQCGTLCSSYICIVYRRGAGYLVMLNTSPKIEGKPSQES